MQKWTPGNDDYQSSVVLWPLIMKRHVHIQWSTPESHTVLLLVNCLQAIAESCMEPIHNLVQIQK